MVRGKVAVWRSRVSPRSHDCMIRWTRGSSPSPAPVGLPVGGPPAFSSTTTSQPAEMSACAHDTPAMLPPTITTFPFFLPISAELFLSPCAFFCAHMFKVYLLIIRSAERSSEVNEEVVRCHLTLTFLSTTCGHLSFLVFTRLLGWHWHTIISRIKGLI